MSKSEVPIVSSHVNLLCELMFYRNGYFHSVLSDAETEFMLRMCVATDVFKYVDVALFTVMFTRYTSFCV